MPMIPVKEAMKGVAIAEPEVKEHDVDLLIVGGGMGACGAAFEAVRWGDKHGLKMMLCDKAASSAPAPWPRACPPSTPTSAKTPPTITSAWSAPTLWVWSAKT